MIACPRHLLLVSGGATVNLIRSQTGVSTQVVKRPEDAKEGDSASNESLWSPVSLSGSPKGVQAAYAIVCDRVDGEVDDVVAEVTVDRTKHSTIIGPKGYTIRKLSAETGVRIHVPKAQERGQASASGLSNDRCVTLEGPAPAVFQCFALVMAVCRGEAPALGFLGPLDGAACSEGSQAPLVSRSAAVRVADESALARLQDPVAKGSGASVAVFLAVAELTSTRIALVTAGDTTAAACADSGPPSGQAGKSEGSDEDEDNEAGDFEDEFGEGPQDEDDDSDSGFEDARGDSDNDGDNEMGHDSLSEAMVAAVTGEKDDDDEGEKETEGPEAVPEAVRGAAAPSAAVPVAEVSVVGPWARVGVAVWALGRLMEGVPPQTVLADAKGRLKTSLKGGNQGGDGGAGDRKKRHRGGKKHANRLGGAGGGGSGDGGGTSGGRDGGGGASGGGGGGGGRSGRSGRRKPGA
jgi:hypothetical protein